MRRITAVLGVALSSGLMFALAPDTSRKEELPTAFTADGRLVCLAEEMKDRYKAEVPPVHDHMLGLKVEAKNAAGAKGPTSEAFAYLTILRTPLSDALFADERFRRRTLRITGRRFPGTTLCELSRFQWFKEGKLFDVYYWCEVCSIRGVNPGPCACCQGKVELREAEAQEAQK